MREILNWIGRAFMGIIDLGKERDKRTKPDEEHILLVDGVYWYKFSAEYTTEMGGTFAIYFWAKDFEDAEKRIKAMRHTLELSGQLYSREDR